MKKLAVLVSTFAFALALASPLQAMEYRLISGYANFEGDLSNESKAPMNALSFAHRDIVLKSHAAFVLGFDVLTTTTKHAFQEFPYPNDQKLKLLVFQLMPSLCSLRWESFRACYAMGLGTVNVNSPKHRQDYGSWHYEFALDWQVFEVYSIGLVTKYVGKVEQRRDGEDTEFWFWNYGLGITYRTAE